MASLYEIDNAIMECIDPETGEIIDAERLTALQMARDKKIEGVACWVKNLDADAAAYKAEKDAFAARQAKAEKLADNLRTWLTEATGGEKMNLPRAAISFRASERVEIPDAEVVPKKYQVKKITYTPDKKAIKEILKSGKAVKGCTLVACKNIQIK